MGVKLKCLRWDGSQLGIVEALQKAEKRAREERWHPEPETLLVPPRDHAEFIETGAICDACNAVRMDERPGKGPCNRCRNGRQ